MRPHLQTGLLIIMTALLCGCSAISKSDYKHLSDAELTARIATLTPIGTPIDEAINVIEAELRSHIYRDEMKHYGPKMRIGYGFHKTPGEKDVVIRSTLANYGWAKNYFLAGSVVNGLWLFDQDGILVEMIVRHEYDGI